MSKNVLLDFVLIFSPNLHHRVEDEEWYKEHDMGFIPEWKADRNPHLYDAICDYCEESYVRYGTEGCYDFYVEQAYVHQEFSIANRLNDRLLVKLMEKLLNKEFENDGYYYIDPDVFKIIEEASGVELSAHVGSRNVFVHYLEQIKADE